MEDKVLLACQVQRLGAVLADTDLMRKAFLMATSLYLIVLGGLVEISVVLKYFVVCICCMCSGWHLPSITLTSELLFSQNLFFEECVFPPLQ